MAEKRTILIGIFCAGIPAIIIILYLFVNLGNWLVVSDPLPAKLDVMFTFGGENVRNLYSLELFHHYHSPHWIVSHANKKALKNLGIDTAQITLVDSCKNTFSEILFLNAWLDRYTHTRGIETPVTVGLVSGPYHMRRIQFLAWKKIHNKSVILLYLPVPPGRYSRNDAQYAQWWKYPFTYHIVVYELQKIVHSIFTN